MDFQEAWDISLPVTSIIHPFMGNLALEAAGRVTLPGLAVHWQLLRLHASHTGRYIFQGPWVGSQARLWSKLCTASRRKRMASEPGL